MGNVLKTAHIRSDDAALKANLEEISTIIGDGTFVLDTWILAITILLFPSNQPGEELGDILALSEVQPGGNPKQEWILRPSQEIDLPTLMVFLYRSSSATLRLTLMSTL